MRTSMLGSVAALYPGQRVDDKHWTDVCLIEPRPAASTWSRSRDRVDRDGRHNLNSFYT